MPLTLLIDLDDTLLINPLESFMPAYIKLLSAHLSAFITAEKMVPQLLYATDRMIAKTSPQSTLEATFDENFYAPLGIKKNELKQQIDVFYEHDFHELKKYTHTRPEAQNFVEYAASKKNTLVIATNPLFPQKAMLARLSWAGFSTENFPFRFVTSYENMHFAKPNPAYYAEILGTLGWQQQTVVMAGNSLKEDILPSSVLGIPGFWVDGDIHELPETAMKRTSAGSLDRLIPWLKEFESNPQSPEFKSIPTILAILQSTPCVLENLTRDLSESDWKAINDTSEWSILESISHLHDVEKEINFPRVEQVLVEQNPFLVGIDSDVWVEERKYNESRNTDVLIDFIRLRTKLVDILLTLAAEDWQRTCRHSIFGPTTLLELLSFVANHDQDHIRHVYNAISVI